MAVSRHGLNFKDGTDTTVTVADNSALDAADVTISVPTTSFIRKNLLTTKGDVIAASASATPARVGVGSNGTVLKAASGQTAGVLFEAVAESELTFTDITTNDVTTSKHGFVPKAPNDTAKFLRGDGTWNSPGGGGGGSSSVATDVIWDAKGDIVAATGADAAVRVAVGANNKILVADSAQTAGVKWAEGMPGTSVLVYRYTVTGSDKSSIDTGADTADAGANDWTNGDLLEVFLYARTDEAVLDSPVIWNVNNDSSSIYDNIYQGVVNTTVSGGNTLAQQGWTADNAGGSNASGVFGCHEIRIPNYMGTVGNKVGVLQSSIPSQTAANAKMFTFGLGYRSTTAISRIKAAPATSGKKFKVGTQLLVYKRIAA